jgi:hypothetical protein
LKPKFDSWLNQKKVQVQQDSQANLCKLTQADISNSVTPAIGQIIVAVKEVKQSSLTQSSGEKHQRSFSDEEEEDEPPEASRKQETTGKSSMIWIYLRKN